MRQPGEAAVVVPDDGDVCGDGDAYPDKDIEQADRAAVVERDDRGGHGPGGFPKHVSRGGAGFLGRAAGNDADMPGEAASPHRGPVSAAALGRARGPAAVEVGDLLVLRFRSPTCLAAVSRAPGKLTTRPSRLRWIISATRASLAWRPGRPATR